MTGLPRFLLVAALVAPAPLCGQADGRLGAIERINGLPSIDGQSATPGAPVKAGSIVVAQGDSWALVRLADRSRVFVAGRTGDGESSAIRFLGLDAGLQAQRVQLGCGTLVFNVPAGRAARTAYRFETTRSASVVIEGAGILGFQASCDRVIVNEGALDVSQLATGATRTVRAGTMCFCPAGKPMMTERLGQLLPFLATIGLPQSSVNGSALLEFALDRPGSEQKPVESKPRLGFVDYIVARRRWILLGIALGVLASIRSARFLAPALLVLLGAELEVALDLSRIWVGAGGVEVPAGALLLGWLATVWYRVRGDLRQPTAGMKLRALVTYALGIWVAAVLVRGGFGGLAEVAGWPRGRLSLSGPVLRASRGALSLVPELATLFAPILFRSLWVIAIRAAHAAQFCPFCRREAKTGVRTLRTPQASAERLHEQVGQVGAGPLLAALASAPPLPRRAPDPPVTLTLEYSWCSSCLVGKLLAILKRPDAAPALRATEVRGAEPGLRMQAVV